MLLELKIPSDFSAGRGGLAAVRRAELGLLRLQEKYAHERRACQVKKSLSFNFEKAGISNVTAPPVLWEGGKLEGMACFANPHVSNPGSP